MPNLPLSEIEVLVWDLDGTLYKSIPQMVQVIEKACINILFEHKQITPEAAFELFYKTREIYKGNTKSLAALGCGPRIEIIKKIEKLVDKASFLNKDPKLQQLFQELSSFRHILLSDTSHQVIVKELEALGLSHNLFELIIGVDDAKMTKPDIAYFKKVLDETDLSAQKHLMIGDRIEIDLLPARQLGMRTCLVWYKSEEPFPSEKNLIDFYFPTVYDIISLFRE